MVAVEILNGESLKTFRLSKGLAQQQLADILRVHLLTVYKWELNKMQPSPYYQGKLQILKKMSQHQINALAKKSPKLSALDLDF
jgi:DNA-binding transcriptional regulator YiaG